MNDQDISCRRLQGSNGTCIGCGRADPASIQAHRIGGILVALCPDCHRRLIERSTPRFLPAWTPPDDLETIAHALLAESDLLSLLAQSRWIFAHALIDRVRREVPDQDEPTA